MPALIWAWIDEPAGIVRTRVFALHYDVIEDEASAQPEASKDEAAGDQKAATSALAGAASAEKTGKAAAGAGTQRSGRVGKQGKGADRELAASRT